MTWELDGLTSKQSAAWGLFQKGIPAIEIARRMETSRQYIHQTLKVAETKIAHNLLEVATSSGLQIRSLKPEKGVLLGFNTALGRDVVLTYTVRHGIRTWYWYDEPEQVKDQKLLEDAKRYLLDEADERGIPLTAEERKLQPAKLARIVFSKLMPGETF